MATLGLAAPVHAVKPRPPAPGVVVAALHFAPSPTTSPASAPAVTIAGIGTYRGTLDVVAGPGSSVAAINRIGVEDYVKGISEVPGNWPLEAQKAQAIAARTFALHSLASTAATAARDVGADLCATDACQVYSGVAKERSAGGQAWAAAVDATRNQVLWFRGGPINAKYSSSNGGRTVAGGQPYLREVDDPDDRWSPLHQWQVAYNLGDIGVALGFASTPIDIHRDHDDIVVTTLDPDAGTTEIRMPAADFRTRMNAGLPTPAGLPRPVPSTRFGAATTDGRVIVDGRGWGHGIGMSQFGALGKALRGLAAPDILAAYYAGLRPVTLPAALVPEQLRVAVALDEAVITVSDIAGALAVSDEAGRPIGSTGPAEYRITPGPTHGSLRVVVVQAPEAKPQAVAAPSATAATTSAPVPDAATAATATLRAHATARFRPAIAAARPVLAAAAPAGVALRLLALSLVALVGGLAVTLLDRHGDGARRGSAPAVSAD